MFELFPIGPNVWSKETEIQGAIALVRFSLVTPEESLHPEFQVSWTSHEMFAGVKPSSEAPSQAPSELVSPLF